MICPRRPQQSNGEADGRRTDNTAREACALLWRFIRTARPARQYEPTLTAISGWRESKSCSERLRLVLHPGHVNGSVKRTIHKWHPAKDTNYVFNSGLAQKGYIHSRGHSLGEKPCVHTRLLGDGHVDQLLGHASKAGEGVAVRLGKEAKTADYGEVIYRETKHYYIRSG